MAYLTEDLHGLGHVTWWESCSLRDLANVSGVGSVLFDSG